ncbi:hypothetical protein E2C01_037615 [Portunus trituberculatus]|uniref:Uncharacterized protein n=1 Tax=Portunus trituberculatus TaxID=210409 RepID=A0A5B7FF26_PORTR|nr:hypothetical protein [Portunus trituberculatus]
MKLGNLLRGITEGRETLVVNLLSRNFKMVSCALPRSTVLSINGFCLIHVVFVSKKCKVVPVNMQYVLH